ncbi:MAG: hypothetical protein AAGF30_04210 [Pseudomonadota bacterium]
MIARIRHGIGHFFQDPLEALADMQANTPSTPVAASCLLLATLVLVLIDMIYGPLAFPQSLQPGGKRDMGAVVVAAVELSRIFAVAASLWIGGKHIMGQPITGATALWMTLPYAISLIGLELVQAASWLLFVLTSINVYGPMFTIGFGGTLLVLVISVRAIAPEKDWLACLPLAAIAFVAGHYLAPAVLVFAASMLILEKLR